MSTEAESTEETMQKINVRVPEPLLAQIDEKWQQRGYASKSAAIRDALRDWLNPPQQLSE